ncbi:MAG: hypothetical protein A4S09_14285 [Proteobacteria bacterium SG_bin7]|nr:MAG: hypothetical protein A4S09_14285 [Proteobacteria bacterium SG_bin7]
MRIPIGEVINSGPQQLHFTFERGVFCVLFDRQLKSPTAIFIDEANCKLDSFKLFLAQMTANISLKSGLKAKLIGTPDLMAKTSEFLQRQFIEILAQVPVGGVAEVYYSCEDGKVRLDKKAIEAGKRPVVSQAPDLALSVEEKKEIKVLIVDDSKTIRDLLMQILTRDPRIKVVAMAEKPSEVESLIKTYKPDVMTLDIHMPEMDGVSLLKKLFPVYSIPTVIVTSVTLKEGPMVLDALESGAVDYIHKPGMGELEEVIPIMINKIITAATANLKAIRFSETFSTTKVVSNEEIDNSILIAIGSSTGGTEALRSLLTRLPKNIPPIVIAQHIPPVFSKAFADRLNELCDFNVKEASNGEEVLPNNVYVAPGGQQMKVKKRAGKLTIEVNDDPPVNRHKPSVDYLFDSVSHAMGSKCVGVILTGMGSDGARGLLNLRKRGARTIAQDQDSCVVFGMPKGAIELGAAEKVLPLMRIPDNIIRLVKKIRAA